MRRHHHLSRIGALVVAISMATSVYARQDPSDGYMEASDGLRIHYLEMGRGTTVMLIHGYTGTARGNWFRNGVAQALAKNHRVIAIDVRGHGKSDKPHEPSKYGRRLWMDVIELMDHLGIERAHVHGYSMGGAITTQLLAHHPERFITAAYGGSGVREVDPEWQAKVPADDGGTDTGALEALATLRASPNDREALEAVRASWREGLGGPIDLTAIAIPVLAINGEFDNPNAKTHRMKRELADFRSVVLPGKSHLTRAWVACAALSALHDAIGARSSCD